jgi:hypothetical protein
LKTKPCPGCRRTAKRPSLILRSRDRIERTLAMLLAGDRLANSGDPISRTQLHHQSHLVFQDWLQQIRPGGVDANRLYSIEYSARQSPDPVHSIGEGH